jgi:AbrB family transcriptional regulator (stage V sporulation protein T)
LANGKLIKIDALGRIVIPREIRKELVIESNETLEIYLYNQQIIIKKHNSFSSYISLILLFFKSIHQVNQGTLLLIDLEKIIISFGDKQKFYPQNHLIRKDLLKLFSELVHTYPSLNLIDGLKEDDNAIVYSIKGEFGVIQGYLIYLYKGNLLENHYLMIKSYAILLEELLR